MGFLAAGKATGVLDKAVGGVSDALGLSGKQGEYYQPGARDEAGMNKLKELQGLRDVFTGSMTGPVEAGRRIDYAQGDMSLSDFLESARGGGRGQTQADINALALDPLTGTRFARDQLMQDPVMQSLYDQDSGLMASQRGIYDRTAEEESRLASQGFQLQPEDYEAYGQASGDIARMFGQQEQSLAEALQRRGLASAPSGAAGQAFSGLMGNKYEQLAKAQTDIANRRMQNTLQRLGQTRQFINNLAASQSQLGNQYSGDLQSQFNRQMAGVEGTQGLIGQQEQAAQAMQGLANEAYRDVENNKYRSIRMKSDEKAPSLGEAFGRGIMSSVSNIGAAPGKFASSLAGAGGKAVSGGMG